MKNVFTKSNSERSDTERVALIPALLSHLLPFLGHLFVRGDAALGRFTVLGRMGSKYSISSPSFTLPVLILPLLRYRSRGRPMVESTWECSVEPEEHTEPKAIGKLSRSRAMASDSASTDSKVRFSALGCRSLRCPFNDCPPENPHEWHCQSPAPLSRKESPYLSGHMLCGLRNLPW